ncbi:MAG: ATP-binding protein [Planctomycetota bacterium]|nr:ATP-binding protein [Planctomycetota bacterium]
MFTNLLSNAIKYNSEGGKVDVSMQLADEQVIVSVSDDGIGMKEEEVAKLFTEFYRAKNEHTRSIPGTGLGLSIVKKLVTLNRGTIEVDSKYGEGTTFTVRIPLRQSDDEEVKMDSSFKY